jgi:hypothetical protein
MRTHWSSVDRVINLEFEYQSMADSVPVAQLDAHAHSRSQMVDLLGASVSWCPPAPPDPPRKRHPAIVWGSLGFTSVAFLFGFWQKRRQAHEEI